MRDILFRGKRVDNKEWLQGSLISTDGDRKFILQSRTKAYVPKNTNVLCSCFCYEVDPETVRQYTGLTDKNGKKIFEGDIINDIDYGIMRCMYLHGSFVFYREDGFHIKCMSYIPVIDVIGNIFDNPDLLTTSPTDSD